MSKPIQRHYFHLALAKTMIGRKGMTANHWALKESTNGSARPTAQLIKIKHRPPRSLAIESACGVGRKRIMAGILKIRKCPTPSMTESHSPQVVLRAMSPTITPPISRWRAEVWSAAASARRSKNQPALKKMAQFPRATSISRYRGAAFGMKITTTQTWKKNAFAAAAKCILP